MGLSPCGRKARALAFGTMKVEKGNILAWQGQSLDATSQDATAQNTPPFAARCLLRRARWAMLATSHGGGGEAQPYASLVTHAVAPDGSVLMLLSTLAAHAGHLAANPRCALMVTGEPENLNWQTAPRLTVTGEAEISNDPAWRAYWLARHPYARLYAGFADFFLWRLTPQAGAFVAGFAQAGSLGANDLAPDAASVAALAEASPGLIAHFNAAHGENLTRLAHMSGATGPWRVLGIDADGFDLVQDESVLRMAFAAPVANGAAAQAALLHMMEKARRHF